MPEVKKKKRKIVQHSSESVEWYTPPEYVAAARNTMGAIDLDPASCAVANRIVRAPRYFDESVNGLKQAWWGRVHLNPPGGIDEDRRSLAAKWWRSIAKRWLEGSIVQGWFVGFTLEILQRAQVEAGGLPVPTDFPLCIPSERPRYYKPVKRPDGGIDLVEDKQPTHAGVLVYLWPRDVSHRREYAGRFIAATRKIGATFNLEGFR